MKKNVFIFLLSIALLYFCLPVCALAKTTQQDGLTEFFTPVRVAVVLDSSGSIIESKKGADVLSRIAAKNFISLLPKGKSEVAVFEYSYTPTLVTELTAINDISSWKAVGDDIIALDKFEGGTGLLDATKAAREYLDSTPSSNEGAKNVIVLFTDGSETQKLNKDTASDAMITQKVSEAVGNSDVIIYSVAFDYVYDDGSHSISGEDGEGYGKKILDKICGNPENVLIVDNNVNELSLRFESIIHDITHSPEPPAPDIVPSDGKTHEIKKSVPVGVAEANLRITSGTLDAVRNSDIELYDPNNNKVDFSLNGLNEEKYWFSSDSMGINIKMIEPVAGEWTLVVPTDVANEDVYISFIPLYNMSIETNIYYNGDTDISEATIGDTLNVETKLNSNGKYISDPEFFANNNISAKVVVSDVNEDAKEVKGRTAADIISQLNNFPNSLSVDMVLADSGYIAGVPIMGESGVKLISILVYSENFICYDEKLVTISKGGEIYIVRKPESITVTNGDSFDVDELLSYCSSDKVSVSLGNYDSNILKVAIDGDKIKAECLKPGKVSLPVIYKSTVNETECSINIEIEVLNSAPKFNKSSYNFSVIKGKSANIDSVLKDVTDLEGDSLSFSISDIEDINVVNVLLDDDSLNLEGKKVGKSSFKLIVSDANSSSIVTVSIDVEESLLSKLIKIIITLAVLIIVLIIIAVVLNKSKRMHLDINNIVISYSDRRFNVLENLALDIDFKKNKVSLFEVIRKAVNDSHNEINDEENQTVKYEIMDVSKKFLNSIIITSNGSAAKGCIMKGKAAEVSLNGTDAGEEIHEILKNSEYRKINLVYHADKEDEMLIEFSCGEESANSFDGYQEDNGDFDAGF